MRQTEEHLAVHEMIKVMDKMPGGFFIYRAKDHGEILFANRTVCRMAGCNTREEFRKLTGNSFRGLVHPGDIGWVEARIREQIARGQHDLDHAEYRIICRDGVVRWVEDYGHFIHSEKLGDIFYVFVSDAADKRNSRISEERKLQNLIDEYDRERKLINQEYLRRLEVIEGLSVNYESILYVNLDSDKVLPYRVSGRIEEQFRDNLQADGFLSYDNFYIDTWVHPDDRETFTRVTRPEYIREKLSGNKTYYINYRIMFEGEIQYLQLRIVNVGNQKRISQVVMGYRRVDEEIRREMEQKQMLEEALNNRNLAIIARNTFLSNMSHDMRTPLNAISGYTMLARKHLDKAEEVREYLDKIEESGRQLLDLIEKVLELSWMESRDIHITETECNLRSVMQDVYESMLPLAAEKHIRITLDTDEIRHADVRGDQEKLAQLLTYLMRNAVSYTENGGKVELTAKEVKRLPNDYVLCQFIVKDTGIGISSDFQKRIFDPFERENNTTVSGVHGTGLGLTIARDIVEMMGGTIDLESALGKGSMFTVTLSFGIQERLSAGAEEEGNVLSQLLNMRILLAEDNEINMEIETEILTGLGFYIDQAKDGRIALEKVCNSEAGYYDMILMDIQMPVLDGWQAAKQIRMLPDPERAHIPIIALSANAFESDKRKSIESGMDEHLTKPIDIPLLLRTMARIIRMHSVMYGDDGADLSGGVTGRKSRL